MLIQYRFQSIDHTTISFPIFHSFRLLHFLYPNECLVILHLPFSCILLLHLVCSSYQVLTASSFSLSIFGKSQHARRSPGNELMNTLFLVQVHWLWPTHSVNKMSLQHSPRLFQSQGMSDCVTHTSYRTSVSITGNTFSGGGCFLFFFFPK